MRTHSGVALMLVGACLVAVTSFAGTYGAQQKTTPKHDNPGMGHGNSAALKMHDEMRMLWEDHISYTRSYMISAIDGLPDGDAVATRLLQNQDDIGKAIEPYYGKEAGSKLAALLRDHILIAADVIKAAKAKDAASLSSHQQRWTANGKDIAVFLSGANPNWKQAELEGMMQEHLELLADQVSARLNKDWNAEIRAYDEGHLHILMMADALSDGITKQFPDKFAHAAN